jgi:hypothetical protein
LDVGMKAEFAEIPLGTHGRFPPTTPHAKMLFELLPTLRRRLVPSLRGSNHMGGSEPQIPPRVLQWRVQRSRFYNLSIGRRGFLVGFIST